MTNACARRAGGYTLVEVMIALCLLSVVCAGAFSSIVVIARAQAASARLEVAQAGARAALEMLTRDAQMASAGVRLGSITRSSGSPSAVLTVRVTDSSSSTDRLELVLVDPSVSATLTASYAGGTLLTVNAISGLAVGDVVQICDLDVAMQLVVTATTATTITVTAPSNALPKTFPAGSYVFKARSVSYYVDATVFGSANPVLMLDPDGPYGSAAAQPIAEGIEDFQVALGFDSDSDGAISSVGSSAGDDEWIHNVGSETAPATLVGLQSVRVTLVARTTSALEGTRGTRPAAENRAAASSSDSYPRRVLRSEIAVRNYNL